MDNTFKKQIKVKVTGSLSGKTKKEFNKLMNSILLTQNDQLVLILDNARLSDLKSVQTLARLNENVRLKGAELILKNISASVRIFLSITQTLNYFNIETEETFYAHKAA